LAPPIFCIAKNRAIENRGSKIDGFSIAVNFLFSIFSSRELRKHLYAISLNL